MSMEEFNIKWLDYMHNLDVRTVTECPNGHKLHAYVVSKLSTDVVITCPRGGQGIGFDLCEYFDYHTFKVSKDTEIAITVERR